MNDLEWRNNVNDKLDFLISISRANATELLELRSSQVHGLKPSTNVWSSVIISAVCSVCVCLMFWGCK
jgi:hypothetical protein